MDQLVLRSNNANKVHTYQNINTLLTNGYISILTKQAAREL